MHSTAAMAFDMSSTDQPESFSISDLASEFDVTPRALRFYEEEGLLQPARSGLARVYSRRDRGRLAWILRGKRVGFSLLEIKELIELYDSEGGPDLQLRVAIERCEERVAMLERQKHDIDLAINELNNFIGAARASKKGA